MTPAHEAHVRPPESMKQLFKRWQKASPAQINSSDEILDLHSSKLLNSLVQAVCDLPGNQRVEVFDKFVPERTSQNPDVDLEQPIYYELRGLPGLYIIPSLLPPYIQVALLDKILHRDLSNDRHNSNLHLHYHIPYPEAMLENDLADPNKSFFLLDQNVILHPKDPNVHKPITVRQMLDRKLRWVTLGGQYDWTKKEYPPDDPPPFPEDIVCLLKGLFPDVDAEAAIVNFYTPGDTLSVHRDVSEDCDRGLISISIGCDGLFVVGNEDGSEHATIRLKSGDAVLMSGESRYAWHAVPKVLPGSCPGWLETWPASPSQTRFDAWCGWMGSKRVNLNVRQMRP